MTTNKTKAKGPQNSKEIQAFIHCKLCLEQWLEEQRITGESFSPRSLARLEVGWTRAGLQVWCVRHNVNVIHIDFQGQKHPANLTRGEAENVEPV